uniref:Uncharacterized protein n=1 Tax=Tanacetum cinerariifolium TaxID=118510 RepID=A0A6L2NI79_TANCI|nr:hypothetical protein [Tanacetum cinerariifolium]
MKDNPQLQQDDLPICLALEYKFERLHMANTPSKPFVVHPRDQNDPRDDAHPEGENSAKRQKTYEHGTFVSGESSSDAVNEGVNVTNTLSAYFSATNYVADWAEICMVTRKRPNGFILDKINYVLHGILFPCILELILLYKDVLRVISDSYAIDDDVIPNKKVSQELVDEMSQSVDEAKLCKEGNNSSTKSIKAHSSRSKLLKSVWHYIQEQQERKRVMRHLEVHKFCDATLKRVLERLKSYNNDVKYGYVTHNLSKEDVEYLQLFVEEIEEWLKYRDQMRRWEMYVNGRLLGSRRERPE